jgi:hypothetical protein
MEIAIPAKLIKWLKAIAIVSLAILGVIVFIISLFACFIYLGKIALGIYCLISIILILAWCIVDHI